MSVFSEWSMRCPECKADDKIDIDASVVVRLTADGTDNDASRDGSHVWDMYSACICTSCDYAGQVRDFTVPEEGEQ